MRARDLLAETGSALRANKGKSALTILGIVIGITAVITMTSLVGGIRDSLMGELGMNAARTIYISSYTGGITDEQIDVMGKELPGYEYLSPVDYGWAESVTSTESTEKASASISGVDEHYFDFADLDFDQGRAFTAAENEDGAMSVILDTQGVRKLFGSSTAQAVGKTITLDGAEATVVGVVTATGGSGMGGDDGTTISVYMPVKTVQSRFAMGMGGYSQVIGLAKDGVDVNALADQTETTLARLMNVKDDEIDENMYVFTLKSEMDSLNSFMSAFQMLAGAVAGISLLVGGIGIMNMMLTNVTERIREIGLRRALGATRRDVTAQFLSESIVITVLGGLIGTLLGYGLSFALSGLVSGMVSTGMTIRPSISAQSVALAVGICIAVGVVFGYYPSRRASRLDPVEALRHQ